jgi:hypothetical protein
VLATSPYDGGLSRESYWAAAPLGGMIAVIYLLDYHMDWGNSFNCPVYPVPAWVCDGHFGDSEFVVAYVSYNEDTEHWTLEALFTSAHYLKEWWIFTFDSSAYTSWESIAFPSKSRWYPRVFVARSKHGNFISQAACNAGCWGTDDCTDNSDNGRIEVDYYRNVGSGSHPLIESASSVDPYVYGGTEYFWIDSPFCGWDEDSAENGRLGCAGPNLVPLENFGFGS